eukprot:scaffold185761_cov22-Cyclotella_meneghiniana.AAC.1
MPRLSTIFISLPGIYLCIKLHLNVFQKNATADPPRSNPPPPSHARLLIQAVRLRPAPFLQAPATPAWSRGHL